MFPSHDPDSVEENINNTPNINNVQDNTFSVFRTCLGDTLIQPIKVGEVQQNTNTTGGGSQGNNNPSGGSGGSGSNSGSGGTGGNPSGPGATTPYVQPNLGPFLGGGAGSGGVNTINGTTSIYSPLINTTVVEVGTITVNNSPFDINVNIFGGASLGA